MKTKAFSTLILGVACFTQSLPVAAAPDLEPHPTNLPLVRASDETGFVSLFNGKDLTGWDGVPGLWSVKDDAITGQTTTENPAKENTFLVWTNGVVGDFELRCQFKLVPGDAHGFANSGVQYRSKIVKPSYFVVAGYQADMEAGSTYTGQIYEEKGRGIICWPGQKVVITPEGKNNVVGELASRQQAEAAVKHGDWNEYVIIAKGNHIQQWVNGLATADLTDEQEAKAAKTGVLALQLHAGAPMMAQFKNIRMKTLE
jgi:Domain of Unknown Function (DUF1080)